MVNEVYKLQNISRTHIPLENIAHVRLRKFFYRISALSKSRISFGFKAPEVGFYFQNRSDH